VPNEKTIDNRLENSRAQVIQSSDKEYSTRSKRIFFNHSGQFHLGSWGHNLAAIFTLTGLIADVSISNEQGQLNKLPLRIPPSILKKYQFFAGWSN